MRNTYRCRPTGGEADRIDVTGFIPVTAMATKERHAKGGPVSRAALSVSETSPLRSNGEGNRSAVWLSGGGASSVGTQAIDAVSYYPWIGQYIGGGDPHYLETERGNISVSLAIGLLTVVVARPVDLDDELGCGAIKIGDKGPDRVLLAEPEFPAIETKQPPEQHLRKA